LKGSIWRTLAAATATASLMLCALCASASAASINVLGPEEVVYDYSTMQCYDGDFFDGNAQAIRDSSGRIQLFKPGNGSTRRLEGPDFNHLANNCTTTLMPSPMDTNPAHYNYLVGPVMYTENGVDVYAVVHTEWHGWEITGACPAGFGRRRCGVGSNSYAVSHDGGETYTTPPPPGNLISTVPPRPTVDDARTGLFSNTNVIKKGSYYYVLSLIQSEHQDVGTCPMRTNNIADPSSWRGWDGTSFSLRFRNPFYENVDPVRTNTCEAVSYENILGMARSITYNTFLNKYVLTGSAVKYDPAQSRYVWGFYFSLSDDLVHWSMRQLIMEAPSLLTHQCGGPDALSYPSILDHDSTDRNFRVTDQNAYLYYVHMHYNAACQLTLDRDLVRVPISFSP
jgi:hypothetical protein